MIKASAGGGGKGLRIAWNDAECRYGTWQTYTHYACSSPDYLLHIFTAVDDYQPF